MYDANAAYVIQLFGHVLSSHVMSRASLGGGIERSEETLSADVRDLAPQYHVAQDYLAHVGSRSWIDIGVHDVSKGCSSRSDAAHRHFLRPPSGNGTTLCNVNTSAW